MAWNKMLSSRTALLSLISLPVIVLIELWVFSMEHGRRIVALRLHLLVIIQVLIFLCVRYIWKRLTFLISSKDVFSLGTLLKIALFIVLAMAQLMFVLSIFLVGTHPHSVMWVSSFCLGIVVFLTTTLIAADVLHFLIRKLVCRRSSSERKEESSNRTETKIQTLLALLCTLILIASGTMIVNGLTIEYVVVPIRGLDHRLNGTTIVQVSDIHLGPFTGRDKLEEIVDRINKLRGDIVVITGDLVDASVETLQQSVEPLRRVQSRLGAYYITGNHEYYTGDVDNWIAEVSRLNVTPLINKRVCLLSHDPKTCKSGLYLAGLEDLDSRILRYGAHSMDIHTTLTGRTKSIPTIVLAHQPKAAAEAIMWDDVRLVLSGHTHGGQFFPFMVTVYLYNPFYAGLYNPREGVYVYVNPGTVYYTIPFRHYRPEITHITLVSS